MKNQLKRKKKKTEDKQHTLEELQKMFEKEQNSEELNKIMGAISDKLDVLSNDD